MFSLQIFLETVVIEFCGSGSRAAGLSLSGGFVGWGGAARYSPVTLNRVSHSTTRPGDGLPCPELVHVYNVITVLVKLYLCTRKLQPHRLRSNNNTVMHYSLRILKGKQFRGFLCGALSQNDYIMNVNKCHLKIICLVLFVNC